MNHWTTDERKLLEKLKTPADIQAFLDDCDYNTDPFLRSPRQVLQEKKAHCFDGALFAAAMLNEIGYPPRLVDLRAVNDDDHILAIFQRNRCFGAIAKSNFVGIRYREPVYKSLRELAMSYFEQYFNTAGEKTLREVSVPLLLDTFDKHNWRFDSVCFDSIAEKLDAIRHQSLLRDDAIQELLPVDSRTYKAGLLGAKAEGLYKATKSSE
jgi:hypothetical protein